MQYKVIYRITSTILSELLLDSVCGTELGFCTYKEVTVFTVRLKYFNIWDTL
jgi:hypothetical protein